MGMHDGSAAGVIMGGWVVGKGKEGLGRVMGCDPWLLGIGGIRQLYIHK